MNSEPGLEELVIVRLCAAGLGVVLAACSGDVLPLGARAPLPYHFGEPQRLANLEVGPKLDNPTLTADLLELCFTAGVAETDTDVYCARRTRRDEAFDDPEPVTAVNSPAFETSAAISADGLTLWFGSNRGRPRLDQDVWRSTRPTRDDRWSAPESVRELNSDGMDIPRPPGLRDRVMPMSSDRETPGFYQTFLAPRSDPSGAFAPPAIVDELRFPESATVDGFLTDDGLTLFFSSNRPPVALDLYVAWRKSTREPFEGFAPLDELNTPDGDERDAWLSPDGTELYFASDRMGGHAIYVSRVWRQR